MLCCALDRSQDSLDNDLQLFLVAPQLVLNQIHHRLSQRVLGLAKRLTHEPFLQPRTPGLTHLHHIQTAPSPPHTDRPISTTLQTAPSAPRYRLPHLHHATDCLISTTLQTALSFSYAGPSVWNNLPQTLHHSDSTSSFKAALKTHLFNNYF